MPDIKDSISEIRIVPVAVFKNAEQAVAAAEMLAENELFLIEVTLRTEAAFKCIETISSRFSKMLVGAGSVLSVESLRRSVDSGARFCVAPCLDFDVLEESTLLNVPFIPGISTPTDLNNALKRGARVIKIFPAADLGGISYINAVCAPFKMMEFGLIPTGGINAGNVAEYYSNPKVIACGLSYIVDASLIEKGDYNTLDERIKKIKEVIAPR